MSVMRERPQSVGRWKKGRILEAVSRHIASLSKWGSFAATIAARPYRRAPCRIIHAVATCSTLQGFYDLKNELAHRFRHCERIQQ
jgi:hypothetical protein